MIMTTPEILTAIEDVAEVVVEAAAEAEAVVAAVVIETTMTSKIEAEVRTAIAVKSRRPTAMPVIRIIIY